MPVEEDLNFLFVDGQNMSGRSSAGVDFAISLYLVYTFVLFINRAKDKESRNRERETKIKSQSRESSYRRYFFPFSNGCQNFVLSKKDLMFRLNF